MLRQERDVVNADIEFGKTEANKPFLVCLAHTLKASLAVNFITTDHPNFYSD
jgi:hypothetical protein